MMIAAPVRLGGSEVPADGGERWPVQNTHVPAVSSIIRGG